MALNCWLSAAPVFPALSAAVTTVSAEPMWMLKSFVALPPALSATRMVNGNVPEVLGVPPI